MEHTKVCYKVMGIASKLREFGLAQF